MFTNDVFFIIYSYVSVLERSETFYISSTQASRHAIVRREVNFFHDS